MIVLGYAFEWREMLLPQIFLQMGNLEGNANKKPEFQKKKTNKTGYFRNICELNEREKKRVQAQIHTIDYLIFCLQCRNFAKEINLVPPMLFFFTFISNSSLFRTTNWLRLLTKMHINRALWHRKLLVERK